MTARKTNILFINTDQQRADSLGCYGNSIVKTPNIDRLAEEGVLFENAYCVHPLCSPSRTTWLTGRYIHSHGYWRNGRGVREGEIYQSAVLKENNYKTALIGKAHLTPTHGDPHKYLESYQTINGISEDECWNFWKNYNDPYFGFEHVRLSIGHGDRCVNGGHYASWLHENFPEKVPLFFKEQALDPDDVSYQSWKSAVPLEIHPATWIADETIAFMEKNKDQPFFATVGFQEPHPPFNPPAPYCYMYNPEDMPSPPYRENEWGDDPPEHIKFYLERNRWDRVTKDKEREILAHYYGAVTMLDDAIGRILKALDDLGLAENTMVVFTSDHGDWLGDHKLWLKGAVHTRGLIRVPLIMKWPGAAKAGLRIKSVASQIDLASTLYDAVNVKEPYGVQGKSMRKVLAGEAGAVRDYALVEHRHECYREDSPLANRLAADLAACEKRKKMERELVNWRDKDLIFKTIVTDQYRLTYAPAIGYGELFDYREDPNECCNLWDTHVELRKSLLIKLLDALIESTDPLPEREYRL
ncbi:MAG: sulfatase-like hydrolase/transferase [Firmicutes bacterium]|nr:sulfatase-like hydrolase/transferase [Bacillota bacterium]